MRFKFYARRLPMLAVGLLAMALMLPATPAWAQGDSSSGSSDYVLNQATYKQVQAIQKLLGKKQYAKAISHAKSDLPHAKNESKYAQALFNQLIAQAYLLQNNLGAAEPYLERIVALDALQPRAQRSTIQQLATVYLSQKQYSHAIGLYKKVIAQARKSKQHYVSPLLYYHLGLAYSMEKQYHSAYKYIHEAIQQRENGKLPKDKNGKAQKRQPVPKSWYSNYFIVVYKLKNYHKANDIAKMLVARWPNDKDFWNYYANTFLLLHDDRGAAAVYALMDKRGLLKSKDEYMQLVSLYEEQKAPYKAAVLLQSLMQKGIVKKNAKNYSLLASTWIQAKEWDKALAALGKQGALSPTGKVYLQQAGIYLNKRNYKEAMSAARHALQKGGLKHPGRAWLLLGQAAYEVKDNHTALNAFRKAENYRAQAQDARGWIKFVKSNNGGG
jgi:tetratricopeptide (TPR) repeat protein